MHGVRAAHAISAPRHPPPQTEKRHGVDGAWGDGLRGDGAVKAVRRQGKKWADKVARVLGTWVPGRTVGGHVGWICGVRWVGG